MIIDVRSKDEFINDHCDNSINIPLSEIGSSIAHIKLFDEVIFVCETGTRSGRAEMFCKNVHNLNFVKNGGSFRKYK